MNLLLRRVRRLRRTEIGDPRGFISFRFGRWADNDQHMYMIRHDHEMINENVIIFVIHQMYVFFNHISVCGECYLRYVEHACSSAVPYNSAKRLLFIF